MSGRHHPAHDAAWKQFFALPVAVEHLLAGFLPRVAALLDPTTLRDVSGEWVRDGGRRRGDSVWRVRYGEAGERSLVLFLEFQSRVDASMTRRVLGTFGMAHERMRRAGALDRDGGYRPLCVVVHSGRRRWNAPGAAARVSVSADGEVLSLAAAPYVMLDARWIPREHLPRRNLVSTLFDLHRMRVLADARAPLEDLGGWLPGLEVPPGPVRAAYAEWLETTMPALFPDGAAELVERATRGDDEETGMAISVAEERARRRLRRARREGREEGREEGEAAGVRQGMQEGMQRGMSSLLRRQVARKFGDAAAERAAPTLAGLGAGELQRVDEWIVDSETVDELIERLHNGRAG